VEADLDLRQALELARQQKAKSLELRSAMSLVRLWSGQNRTAEGRLLLSQCYGSFAEGLDTPDLKEARALLEEPEPGGVRISPPIGQ
jgi:predicted ATPase